MNIYLIIYFFTGISVRRQMFLLTPYNLNLQTDSCYVAKNDRNRPLKSSDQFTQHLLWLCSANIQGNVSDLSVDLQKNILNWTTFSKSQISLHLVLKYSSSTGLINTHLSLKPKGEVVQFSFNSEAKNMLQNKLDIKHDKHIF